jgi:CBS domain-containing protein
MPVASYCRRDAKTASADESLRDAAKRMDAAGVGSLVVVGEGNRPIGVVTDRDVVLAVLRRGLDPATTPVSEILERAAISVTEQASLAVAIRMMRQGGVRRLPVVDGKTGEVVGVLASDDVLQLLAAELGAASDVVRYQLPPELRGQRAIRASGGASRA